MSEHHAFAATIELGSRRILKPGGLRWLRALGWMVGMFALILLSVGPGMEPVRHLLPKEVPQADFFFHVVSAAIVLLIYTLLVRFGEDRSPDELALRAAPAQLAIGLVLGAVMFATVMAILAASHLYTIDWHGAAPAWRAGGLAFQAALIEEILVRGILFRLLWRAFGPAIAFAASAALFGLGHIVNPGATLLSALCIALEAGVMLGAFYALTGRLWVSIGVHGAWNFTQGYIFGAAVSGGDMGPALARSVARADVSTLLSGGTFGPEASPAALLVCTGVGIAALLLAWKGGKLVSATPIAV